jgi:hypothetical protein
MPKSEESRKPRPKKKKNESLELLRAITKSMASSVSGISQEASDVIDDSLARPLSGFASQVLGEDPDEPGKLVFPPLHNLKRSWNADARRKAGLPRQEMALPGLISDSMALPDIVTLGNGPQWSKDASDRSERVGGAINEGMGLAPAEGFRQHALESAGMMGAQIPFAGKAKEIPRATQGALQLLKKYGKKAAASPFEFFLPTIDPKMSNYLFGSVAGGGLGTLGDEAAGVAEDLPPLAVSRAKGGKIGSLQRALENLSLRVAPTPTHPRGYRVSVLKNPSKEDVVRFTGRDPNSFSMFVDDSGNSYVWSSSEAAHTQIMKALGLTPDKIPVWPSEILTPDDYDVLRELPEKKAKGGKVGALKELLRAISMNPDSTVRQTQHVIGDPVEEVLHATNEGQRKGVIGPEEAQDIKSLLASGDEDALADALMNLQSKLFMVERRATPRRTNLVTEIEVPSGMGKLPAIESDLPLLRPPSQLTTIPEIPQRVRPAQADAGHGLLDEVGDRKARGGKIVKKVKVRGK